MRCARCDADNREDRRFCAACGGPLATVCPRCGFSNEAEERFCGGCGVALAGLERPVEARFATPRAYTPRYLAEKVLTSKAALEGERKQVTVLFVDIVESSRLAEHLDPEAMHELMNRVLGLMADSVHRYEGTVNQFLGDGLMALFGAPVALEDHAYRAVQAAMAIQETVSGYSEHVKRERGAELRLRIGLNSGLVVVGRIGDDLRMDYTAVGDTTHLAARMQAAAEPGTILMSEATHRLVEGYVRTEPLGAIELKHRGEPVAVFRVIGRGYRRSRLDVSGNVSLTELVDRERELDVLRDRLSRARAGRGQVVGLVGEPGVGKSRLIHELQKSVPGAEVSWLVGRCVAYGQTTPYLPILEMLSATFQIEEGDNSLQIDEKLRRGIRRLDLPPDDVLPFMRELFGVADDEGPLKHLDSKIKRRKIFEAIRTLILAGSQRRLQVFLLEDLHWIDETSEECIQFLIQSLSGVQGLLLTTHRPGYTVPWTDTTHYTQIALDLLSRSDVELMLQRLIAPKVPPDVMQLVWEKADGNPLFVEEIAIALREGRLKPPGRRAGMAARPVVDVPGTVQDIIRARLDRLDEPIKRTLQTAAAIGRAFSLNLLTRVTGRTTDLPRDLDTLQHLELIHEIQLFPEPEYVFKHGVIQDVAYQSLLGPRRKELHGAIGRAIEELYADRLEEHAPLLAYHFARSDELNRATEYALVAGDRAARLFANAEATTYYEQALGLILTQPESPARQRTEIDAIIKLAAVGLTQQDVLVRDRLRLESARRLAEDLGDEPRLAQVLYWLGRISYVLWQPPTAIAYAAVSLEIAERLGDERLAAPPVNLMGRVYWQQSEYAKASQWLERSIEQMRQLGNKTEEATAAGFAGFALAYLGQFERAIDYVNHGLKVAAEIQNPFAEAASYLDRAIVRAERGEAAAAFADFEKAREIAERAGDVFRIYVVKFFEGRARTMADDVERGCALIEESITLGAELGTTFALAWPKAFLAHGLSVLGRTAAALPLCQEAILLAEDTGDRFPYAFAQRILAEGLFRIQPDDTEQADHAFGEALRTFEEIGTRPELARTYVSYAQFLGARGDRRRARDLMSAAIAMFDEMGMTRDRERAARTQLEGERDERPR